MTFHPDLEARLEERMARHVEADEAGGLAWLAWHDGEVAAGTAGVLTRGEDAPVERDSLFRIASTTKPLTAVAALLLVEECRLRLEDPVDDLLPELADRRVLVDPLGPLDGETVAAVRPITVRDLLTSRCGLGLDFASPWPQPLFDAMCDLGLTPGAPEPRLPPAPDEWIRRVGTLPLVRQPGERWLYNVPTDILGVLVARSDGRPLDVVLHERVLDPLGMGDTGFSTGDTDRLVTCYSVDPSTGARAVFDPPDGQWATSPAFPSGAGGLVSTVDDYATFGRMLLAGGRLADGSRLLEPASVEAMTADQLGSDGNLGVAPDRSLSWGFGVGVQVRTGPDRRLGSYGWDGGLGSSWVNDPTERLVGVVASTDMFNSAELPLPLQDFWTTVYGSLGG